jgi:hypothetical protein
MLLYCNSYGCLLFLPHIDTLGAAIKTQQLNPTIQDHLSHPCHSARKFMHQQAIIGPGPENQVDISRHQAFCCAASSAGGGSRSRQ